MSYRTNKTLYHSENDVDIVYFSLDDDICERERLYRLLSDDEKQRVQRYYFDRHRHCFIGSRGKLREILANKGKCQPDEIIFALSEFGKPFIREPSSLQNVQFNASSSGLVGAVAISHNLPLGFDIEQIQTEKGRDFDLIVQAEFTREEFDWYWQYKNSINRDLAFYTLWTCKEAYLKALGIGLLGELGKFSINLQGNRPVITYTELEQSSESALILYQLNIDADVVACLALSKKDCRIGIIYWKNNEQLDKATRTK